MIFSYKIWLCIEFLTLFILTPFVLFEIGLSRMGVFGVLWFFCIGAGYYLYRTKKLKLKITIPKNVWRGFWVRLALVGFSLFVGAYFLLPDRFLSLPLERPELMARIALFYPILSALPQEILYRSFIFHRYPMLRNNHVLFIGFSALAFALAHWAFQNYIALGIGLIGGLLFACSYWRHRSLTLVTLEHSLYGLIIFASGWGWYFYLGAGHSF